MDKGMDGEEEVEEVGGRGGGKKGQEEVHR